MFHLRTLTFVAPILPSLSEPQGQSSLVAAALWLQAILLGSVATAIAVIAVAAIGFMMLTGRVNLRRGASVVVGCFILFGAPFIAAGLYAAVAGVESGYADPDTPRVEISGAPPGLAPPDAPATPYDPYAGASVPPR